MPSFSFPASDNTPRFVDTGQGAAGRIASWMAWTTDPTPLAAALDTRLIRTDDNGGVVPLGQGGCGTWKPILTDTNGAAPGGSDGFYNDV